MPNPREPSRTPAPSRIGKTLGAILSAPRRGAADADDTGQPAEPTRPAGALGDAALPPERFTDQGAMASPGDPAAADQARGAPTSGAATLPQAPPAVPAAVLAPTADVTADEPEVGSSTGGTGGGSRQKKRETFLIPEDLADAMRNAIVHLSGPPLYYTLAEFGEHAIRGYIAQLEREHNAGRPFPPRPRAVRQGRPLR